MSDCVAFGGVDDRPKLEMNGTLGSASGCTPSPLGLGFRVQGLGFGVQGSGFRV